MKKISLIIFTVVVACTFAACSGTADNSEADSDEAADNVKTRVDTTSIKIVAKSDTTFAREAAASSIAAVALSKLALTKSSNEKIKMLATMVLKDHDSVNTELKEIAKAKAFKLPVVLEPQYLAKKKKLQQLSGVMFDKAYVTSVIDGHKKILKLLQNEAEHGSDAELKAFAAKTAITVQTRLDEINEIYQPTTMK